ncbi:flavin monoamine oxidase family protein [Mesorhizobium sp. 8]|uniref:flavin monoamine oxidase family protein n=1 Tax=Mesorhizobium sp. 8 TaxID=2584466 RepID=UPI001122B733|nr:flavin monoamine oxidase family protein [Mesorhizobium sp. 8]QDC01189.1 flavin monoamine oxidase family protein [Mesorhizobium sp. 8]
MSGARHKTGVVIVGAGFAGLSAAHALKHAGVDFVVIEAQDHVGGRVESRLNGQGERVDTGGQFLCDDMPEFLALARTYGRQLVETRFDGAPVRQPPLSVAEIERSYAGAMAIRDRLNGFSPDDPSLAGLTVADWLARQPDDDDARDGFRSMIEGLWCLALEDLPAWYLVSNDRRVTNEASELQYFIAGNTHSLAKAMARELGDRIRLDTEVTGIRHGTAGVQVTMAGVGDRPLAIDARAVLICLPPATAAKLDYAPVLPTGLAGALGAWRSGAVIKLFLRYPHAFWRERNLSGVVMWRDPAGLFAFDVSPDEAHPTLGFFIGGPLAQETRALGEAGVKEKTIAWLVAAIGPEAGEPLDVMLRDWTNDRWSGGAYSDIVVDMGATDAEEVLRAGAPPLFFAASELSPSFPGYIEGAIVAGREGAKKVVATLQSAIATSASGS